MHFPSVFLSSICLCQETLNLLGHQTITKPSTLSKKQIIPWQPKFIKNITAKVCTWWTVCWWNAAWLFFMAEWLMGNKIRNKHFCPTALHCVVCLAYLHTVLNYKHTGQRLRRLKQMQVIKSHSSSQSGIVVILIKHSFTNMNCSMESKSFQQITEQNCNVHLVQKKAPKQCMVALPADYF